ncbi:GM12061 [Drosophila sechellia]|uniref:GM12061 n=1 Tax=Drosophila sechellia TaxID=7238 RepID=B4IJA5_DROSE|nr:GM12061 [Drosophila sechellia]
MIIVSWPRSNMEVRCGAVGHWPCDIELGCEQSAVEHSTHDLEIGDDHGHGAPGKKRLMCYNMEQMKWIE